MKGVMQWEGQLSRDGVTPPLLNNPGRPPNPLVAGTFGRAFARHMFMSAWLVVSGFFFSLGGGGGGGGLWGGV